jgi:aspartate/methionine/tyrosine aminotransferase
MQIDDFKLERYFAAHEFRVRYLLSASDCEALALDELLGMADDETLALWRDLRLNYTESQGHPLLRSEVAGPYQTVRAADVLIAAPEELIFIATNALLRPGDHVIVTFPGYQSLYAIADALGCPVTRWPLEVRAGRWSLDLNFLAAAIRPETRLLVVNFPHNPTGYSPSKDELDAIIELARRHGLYVFSDEMYRLLEYDVETRLPPVADLYERGLSLSGLSKSFALPGLRIGWLAMRDADLLARCIAFHDYTTICAPAPSEILGIMALRAQERIIARNLAIIRRNRDKMAQFCARHGDLFTWLPPQAGSIAFPQIRGARPVGEFCRDVLEKQDVMILPGDVFDHAGNHFRVGLGRTNFPEALARVEEHIQTPGAWNKEFETSTDVSCYHRC